MTGKGHFATGLCLSVFTYKFTMDSLGVNSNYFICILAALGTIIGSMAPDWLEIVKSNGSRVIRHRTITHWLPLWIVLFYISYSIITKDLNFVFIYKFNSNLNYLIMLLGSFFLGFSIGGLLHLLFDIPNPMGIPILTPYKRFSFKLWRSGKNEPGIIMVTFLFSLYYIGIINFNLSEYTNLIIK